MKFLSESSALMRLQAIKSTYRGIIQEKYEPHAKSCLTCETQGACCLDEHFVNVHITALETVSIRRKLEEFPTEKQNEIYSRIEKTVEKYNLTDTADSFGKTFACPLFEKGTGCLVHVVKPVPCIQHACYERREDLPPNELQAKTEDEIEKLNERAYGKKLSWLPLPLSLLKSAKNKLR